jgi:hypothetical protein
MKADSANENTWYMPFQQLHIFAIINPCIQAPNIEFVISVIALHCCIHKSKSVMHRLVVTRMICEQHKCALQKYYSLWEVTTTLWTPGTLYYHRRFYNQPLLERHAVQFLSIGEVSLFSTLCILCIKSQSLSAIKLWDGEIGSLEKTDNAKTVLFPSFTPLSTCK